MAGDPYQFQPLTSVHVVASTEMDASQLYEVEYGEWPPEARDALRALYREIEHQDEIIDRLRRQCRALRRAARKEENDATP